MSTDANTNVSTLWEDTSANVKLDTNCIQTRSVANVSEKNSLMLIVHYNVKYYIVMVQLF